MSYAAANERHRRNEWVGDRTQVLNFATDLKTVGVLTTADDMLEYFHTPSHWSREHEWWMAHGCTDDPEAWAQAGMT